MESSSPLPPTLKHNTNADEYSLHTEATGAKLDRQVGNRELIRRPAFQAHRHFCCSFWNNSTRQTAPEYKTHYWHKKIKIAVTFPVTLTSILFNLFPTSKTALLGQKPQRYAQIRTVRELICSRQRSHRIIIHRLSPTPTVTPLPPTAFEKLVWLARSRRESMKRRKQVLRTQGWLCKLSVSVSSAKRESAGADGFVECVFFKTFNLDVSKFPMKRNRGAAADKIKQTANNCPRPCFKLGVVEAYKDTGRV